MNLTESRVASVRIAAVAGRVDHAGADEFRQKLWPVLVHCGEGADSVVLDLSGLDYISSAGLRVLMLAAREVKPRNGRIVVAALQPVVREIFEISRFNLLFQVYPDPAAALAALQAAPLAPPNPAP